MNERRLTSFATYPYIEESLTALEFAYQIRDFNVLRGKLEDWFPRPGPGMRKRAVREIIRRFIRYEDNRVFDTPLLAFVNVDFSKQAKKEALYYHFVEVHPIVTATLKELRTTETTTITNDDAKIAIFKLLGKEIDSKNVNAVLATFVEFGLMEKVNTRHKRFVPQKLEPPSFLYVLYQHFLAEGSIAPKNSDIQKFFYDTYNMSEETCEQLITANSGVFYVIERKAHLNQILLQFNAIEDFMAKLLEYRW